MFLLAYAVYIVYNRYIKKEKNMKISFFEEVHRMKRWQT